MSPRPHYTLAIGDWSVDSTDDPRTEVVAIATETALGGARSSCRVEAYVVPAADPGLLEQAVGAAAGALGLGGGEQAPTLVTIRGTALRGGDTMRVDLGDDPATVFTGRLVRCTNGTGGTVLAGVGHESALLRARLVQRYEGRSLGDIVRDVADQLDVEVGDVADGSELPFVAIHDGAAPVAQLDRLAAGQGLDLFVGHDGKLVLRRFDKTRADHTLRYGKEILRWRSAGADAETSQVTVVGESPSSGKGRDTWHWLVKDTGPCRAEAGDGERRRWISDGAVRTRDAARALAQALRGRAQDATASGRVTVLGNPAIRLGDAIEIADVPQPEANGLRKVVAVRHVLSKREGFVTTIAFRGTGGAAGAGGLAGELIGAAGGLGL